MAPLRLRDQITQLLVKEKNRPMTREEIAEVLNRDLYEVIIALNDLTSSLDVTWLQDGNKIKWFLEERFLSPNRSFDGSFIHLPPSSDEQISEVMGRLQSVALSLDDAKRKNFLTSLDQLVDLYDK